MKKQLEKNTARSELNLAGKQLDLVKRLKETGKKVIVLYIRKWKTNFRALFGFLKISMQFIEVWEPGSFGGIATAEIIFDLSIETQVENCILKLPFQIQLVN